MRVRVWVRGMVVVTVVAGDIEIVVSGGWRGRSRPRIRELRRGGRRGIRRVKVQLPVTGVGV